MSIPKLTVDQMDELYHGHQSGDGKLPAACAQIFGALDADGTGFLERLEIKSAWAAYFDYEMSDEKFVEVMNNQDTNGDGKLGVKEFTELIYMVRAPSPHTITMPPRRLD